LGGAAEPPGGSEDGGLDEFFEFIPKKPFQFFYPPLPPRVFLFQLPNICVFVHTTIIGQKQDFASTTQDQVNAYKGRSDVVAVW